MGEEADIVCPHCRGTGKIREHFGHRLVEARKKAGITQQQLADRVRLSRAQVANMEAGRSKPKVGTLLLCADLFKVSVDWLLAREPRP